MKKLLLVFGTMFFAIILNLVFVVAEVALNFRPVDLGIPLGQIYFFGKIYGCLWAGRWIYRKTSRRERMPEP